MNQPSQELLDSLLGKTKEEAYEICNKSGFDLRLNREDDIHFVGTCDLRFDRINIQIDNGTITSSNIG